MEIKCFNCSSSVLFPDGRLRCKLDNHLAVEPCVQHNPGSPEIYRIKFEKPEIVKHKVKAEPKSKIAKPIIKKVKKPSLQRKLL